jgi:predicted cupin superfamily sugar epimerase
VPRIAVHPRATGLIDALQLAAHPEGGWYREVHRSALGVRRDADGAARAGLTTIFFLLAAGERSRWHRVQGADEAWHHYEGAPLELLSFAPDGSAPTITRLGTDAASRVHVIPAGWWQAARPTGDYALVGCTVGPGFDFADFAMLRDLPPAQQPPRPALDDFDAFV